MSRILLFSLAFLACGPSKDEGADSGKDSDSKVETGEETGVEDQRPAWRNPEEAIDLDPSEEVVRIQLEAAAFQYEVDGETIDGWAFNGQVPGPTIRVPNGALLPPRVLRVAVVAAAASPRLPPTLASTAFFLTTFSIPLASSLTQA